MTGQVECKWVASLCNYPLERVSALLRGCDINKAMVNTTGTGWPNDGGAFSYAPKFMF